MTALILAAAIAGLPLLWALFFRVNAIYLFAAVTCGQLLATYMGDDAKLIGSMLVKGDHADTITMLILLWLPVVMVLLFARKSLPSSKLLFHAPALVLTCLSAALLTITYLSTSFQQTIYATHIGSVVESSKDLIIAGAGVATLLVILLFGRSAEHGHKRKHHK